MKQVYFLFFFILTVLTFKSCKEETESITEEVTLKIDTIINQLSDSSFLTDIRSIYFSNSKYYMTDYTRDQIFILSKDLELIKTIGKKGRGPGEFSGASHLFADKDSIFVYNDSKITFEVYNTKKHLKTIQLPVPIRLHSSLRYFMYKNELYFSNANSIENYSISKLNCLTNKVANFGQIKKFRTPKETRIKNHRHLIKYKDYIIAVPNCQAVIEMYDFKGKFLNKFDISNIKPIKEMLTFINEQKSEENSYYVLFSDVYVYKNRLFLTMLTNDKYNKRSEDKVLEIEINTNKIIYKRILKLSEKSWFGPICINEGYLLAFNEKDELIRFVYD